MKMSLVSNYMQEYDIAHDEMNWQTFQHKFVLLREERYRSVGNIEYHEDEVVIL